MLRSLRARLLLWYSVIFSLFIVIYAGTVTYVYRNSLMRQVDDDLRTAAGEIGEALSPDIDGTFDLVFPAGFRERTFSEGTAGTYYALWNPQGQLVDQSDPSATPHTTPDVGVRTNLNRRELVIDAQGRARV